MLRPLPHGRDTLHVCGRRGRMSRGRERGEGKGEWVRAGQSKSSAAACIKQSLGGRRQLTRIGTFVRAPLIRRELRGATPRWAGPSLPHLSLQEQKGLCLLLLLSLSLSLLYYVTPPTESFQRRGT